MTKTVTSLYAPLLRDKFAILRIMLSKLFKHDDLRQRMNRLNHLDTAYKQKTDNCISWTTNK